MAHQRPHVPQFGKWDNTQNAAYTVYFDQARKGRTAGGKMMNPNDPEDNPDILPSTMTPAPPAPRRKDNQVPARGRTGSVGLEHSIERFKNQGAAVPVFGEWDAKNPASAEGYTDIFNQVREERVRGPSNTPGRDNYFDLLNNQQRNPASSSSDSHKVCCFPWCRLDSKDK